ncbi:MAG: type II toxin-antitoxin system HicA family toxin [Firmicutes bacterium]|nr:type II toxin-antitoxin system HicA family toxin [Bacillota bacterium]
MSKWDKLLLRIHTLSGDLRFEEVKRVLEFYGYEMRQPRGGSSHCTFRKPGRYPVTIPSHEPIKKVYVELVRDIVEMEAGENENN